MAGFFNNDVPTYKCPKCGFTNNVYHNNFQYGLWEKGRLIMCSTCLEALKKRFWSRIAREEEGLPDEDSN